MSAALQGHGITVRLPERWEGRIYRRPQPNTDFAAPDSHAAAARGAHPAGAGWLGELSYPVTHLANFALPPRRGDYGTGAVERMGPRHIFVSLLEFAPDCLGTALYTPQGLLAPRPRDFGSDNLQRRLAGQAGYQRFFTAHDRPMCLYIVLGSHRNASVLCAEVSAVLAGIEVSAA